MTLDTAINGQNYRIINFDVTSEEQVRLMELGFQAGEPLAILQTTPLCDLLKVCIKGTRFAIRKADARCIQVEQCEPCEACEAPCPLYQPDNVR